LLSSDKAMGHRAGGMLRLEFLLVLCLVLMLVGAFLYRLRDLQRAVEQTSVLAVLDTVRTGLWVEMAARATAAGDGGMAAVLRENPFAHLQGAVPAYGGLWRGEGEGLQDGGWYFDEKNSLIIYKPRFPENFFTTMPSPKGVQFQIRALYREDARQGRIFEGFKIAGKCECSWLPKHYAE